MEGPDDLILLQTRVQYTSHVQLQSDVNTVLQGNTIVQDLQAAHVGVYFGLFSLIFACVLMWLRLHCSDPALSSACQQPPPCKEQTEFISNRFLLGFFNCLIRQPQLCSLALTALVLASGGIASRWSWAESQPIHLGPGPTRLREAHLEVQDDFNASTRLRSLVLIWHGGNDTAALDLRKGQSKERVDAVFAEIEAQLHAVATTRSCEGLTWDKPHEFAEDGSAVLMHLALDRKSSSGIGEENPCISDVRSSLRSLDNSSGLRVTMASKDAVIDASMKKTNADTLRHLCMSAPFMTGLLLIGVGSWPRALTPFISLLSSYVCMRASMVLLKCCWVDLNLSAPDSIVVFVLLALCFDYSLFFWVRFTEENRTKQPAEAVAVTLQTSGYVIMLSMAVLLIGFSVSSVYPDYNQVGFLAISIEFVIGILFTALYSLAVPAVLIMQFPGTFAHTISTERDLASGFSARSLMNRPRCFRRLALETTGWPCVAILPLVVLALFVPLLQAIHNRQPNFDFFALHVDKSVPEFQAHHIYKERFHTAEGDAVVLLEAVPDGSFFEGNNTDSDPTIPLGDVTLSAPFREGACRFSELLLKTTQGYGINTSGHRSFWWDSQQGCEEWVFSKKLEAKAFLLSKSGKGQVVLLPGWAGYGETEQSLTRIFWDHIEPEVASWSFKLGERQYSMRAALDTPLAEDMLMQKKYNAMQPWLLLIIVTSVCLLVGRSFGSAFVAAKMVFTVILPIAAEYGLLVAAYQYGWLTPLGIDQQKVSWRTFYTTTGFLFALAMDYDLFLFARVYERRMQGYDNRSAVRLGVEETGPVIMLGGSLMVVAFFFIFLSGMPQIAQMGFLYCFGVAVDTYIVRVFVAPAALCIYEPMNYWPGLVPVPTRTYKDAQ